MNSWEDLILDFWPSQPPIQNYIRRALAQGVSDHQPLDSHKEQHPFFYRSHPQMDNFQSKNGQATAAATVAVVVAVVAQIVSCSGRARGGCQGASGSGDRQPFLRRVTFFLHLFLGILRLLIFSYFVQNWSPNSSQNGVHF